MRQSGILMPVSALPGAYGIGSFSKEAYKFVDWLQKSGQSLWQILPLGPTSYGDSPYQSFSTFAGNPYFIDLETLAREGLLEDDICRQADFGNNPNQIDYGMLYQNRFHILKVAYEHAKEQQIMNSSDYVDFLNEQNEWLSDYALYMSVKDYFHGAGWNLWEENIRLRRPDAISHYQDLLTDEIHFYQFLQYEFYKQWNMLKEYANQKGLVELVKKVKEKFPNKTIWCYTGFDFEKDVMGKMYKNWEETRELVDNIDVIVDGKFEIEKKNPSLKFRGSENQRLIDVQKSIKLNKIIWADIEDEEIKKAN